METLPIKKYPWTDLGVQPYKHVWDLQEKIREEILASRSSGELLITQHTPTISLGRAEKGENVFLNPDQLAQLGFTLVQSNRGGKVTYHGPGQLVAYPIFDLRTFKMGVKQYVHALEETMLSLLNKIELNGERIEKCPGAWVRGKKIGSIGIHVRKQVSIHGLAFNVTPDLNHFNWITPCGISGIEMTSVLREGKPVSLNDTIPLFIESFEEVFHCSLFKRDHFKTGTESAHV